MENAWNSLQHILMTNTKQVTHELIRFEDFTSDKIDTSFLIDSRIQIFFFFGNAAFLNLTLEGPCIIFCNIYTFQRDIQCSSTDCLLMHRCQLYMFRTVTVHPQELLFRCCMCRLWYVARNALSDTSRWYNVWGSNIMVKGKHKIPFKSRNFSYKQKSWRTILLHIPHLDPNPTSF